MLCAHLGFGLILKLRDDVNVCGAHADRGSSPALATAAACETHQNLRLIGHRLALRRGPTMQHTMPCTSFLPAMPQTCHSEEEAVRDGRRELAPPLPP